MKSDAWCVVVLPTPRDFVRWAVASYGRDAVTGSVFSYVANYPTLEAALKKLNNFAAVVMEYSPPDQDPSGKKFVKFFAFVPDDKGDSARNASFNFDGRGEKWVPGVCTACHGGRPTFLANGAYANHGDVNAGFLPFDLNSYLYVRATDTKQVDPDLNAAEFTSAQLEREQKHAISHRADAFVKLFRGF